MFLYWRIQQDLNCLGEIIQFHDPALSRSLREWMRKNFTGLIMAEDTYTDQNLFKNQN